MIETAEKALAPDPALVAFAALAVLAGLVGSAWVWAWIAARWHHGLAVLRYWPRRPAPWRGWDVLLVVLFYLVAVDAARHAVVWVIGPEAAQPPPIQNLEKTSTAHLIARLIASGNPWVVLLTVVAAGVVAPLVEEFLFRVLLQGWLESALRRHRRQLPTLRRLFPGASGPIVLSSLLFAMMHFRVSTPEPSLQFTVGILLGQSLVNVLVLAFALGLLRCRAGATPLDLGCVPQQLPGDVRLGLVAFVAVAAPLYALQFGLSLALPKWLAPDPFALFFFALVLGVLYHRTHRWAPSVVLHMALNLTSLAMAWLVSGK